MFHETNNCVNRRPKLFVHRYRLPCPAHAFCGRTRRLALAGAGGGGGGAGPRRPDGCLFLHEIKRCSPFSTVRLRQINIAGAMVCVFGMKFKGDVLGQLASRVPEPTDPWVGRAGSNPGN